MKSLKKPSKCKKNAEEAKQNYEIELENALAELEKEDDEQVEDTNYQSNVDVNNDKTSTSVNGVNFNNNNPENSFKAELNYDNENGLDGNVVEKSSSENLDTNLTANIKANSLQAYEINANSNVTLYNDNLSLTTEISAGKIKAEDGSSSNNLEATVALNHNGVNVSAGIVQHDSIDSEKEQHQNVMSASIHGGTIPFEASYNQTNTQTYYDGGQTSQTNINAHGTVQVSNNVTVEGKLDAEKTNELTPDYTTSDNKLVSEGKVSANKGDITFSSNILYQNEQHYEDGALISNSTGVNVGLKVEYDYTINDSANLNLRGGYSQGRTLTSGVFDSSVINTRSISGGATLSVNDATKSLAADFLFLRRKRYS